MREAGGGKGEEETPATATATDSPEINKRPPTNANKRQQPHTHLCATPYPITSSARFRIFALLLSTSKFSANDPLSFFFFPAAAFLTPPPVAAAAPSAASAAASRRCIGSSTRASMKAFAANMATLIAITAPTRTRRPRSCAPAGRASLTARMKQPAATWGGGIGWGGRGLGGWLQFGGWSGFGGLGDSSWCCISLVAG